jgi:hypothetical protein
MIAILSVIGVLLLGYNVRSGHLFIEGLSKPSIAGAYRDERGGKFEFLADGSLTATIDKTTGSARWTRVDDAHIRLEPETLKFLGEICQYRFSSYKALSITDCAFSANLSRL